MQGWLCLSLMGRVVFPRETQEGLPGGLGHVEVAGKGKKGEVEAR